MLKTALMFADNMIIQSDKTVAVWGTSEPNADICISMQNRISHTTADDSGYWNAMCGPFNTSFDESMTIESSDERLIYSGVQVGEVWLAGGQSNMEFHMRYDTDFSAEKTRCTNDNIRFFDYPEVSYPGQIDEADYLKEYGFWRKAKPEQLERFSAVGYYFAKELQSQLNVPIGIIGCNWGGTPAAAWMSREAIIKGGGQLLLDEYEEIEQNLDPDEYEAWFQQDQGSWRIDQLADPINDVMMFGGTDEEMIRKFAAIGLDMSNAKLEDFQPVIGPKHERRPSGLYNSMLCQVAPYTVRGVIWYQGETDGDTHPELYRTLFPALIEDWRRLWNDDFPFLFVQTAPLGKWLDCIGERYVAIREAQQETADTVENTGMAVITDIGNKDDIHPKKKQPVGYRLALQAENKAYGMPVLCEAPTLVAVAPTDGRLELKFINTGEGLSIDTNRCHAWLEISQAGVPIDTGKLSVAASGDTLTIFGEDITADKPTEVRLAKTGWYQVNLHNSAGIPARPAVFCYQEEI